jgi:hypothetical protein
MNRGKRRLWNLVLAAIVGIGGLFTGDNFSVTAPNAFVSKAEARVGHPATPGSVAGVARRTTRRVVLGGPL